MLRPAALAALTTAVVFVFAAVACQTYDFEPVTPLTLAQTVQKEARYSRALKPNVMLLVDQSGSMLTPINRNGPNCNATCGSSSPCPPGCATRITELRSAMSAFLTNSGTIARFGLTFFPSNESCAAANDTTVDLPPRTATDQGTDAVLTGTADQIRMAINTARTPIGGTPTGASLGFTGASPELGDRSDGRDDFVLLLTDGLPNCNAANPTNVCGCVGPNPDPSCPQTVQQCRCTLGNCLNSSSCRTGCLDQDGTVAQIRSLRAQGIRTIVVGFGADTGSGDAYQVLQAMGEAGGFSPACPRGTDAECGAGGRCEPGPRTCERKFFQAANSAELEASLAAISGGILTQDACTFLLYEKPSDPRFLAVLVEGEDVPPGPTTWDYRPLTTSIVFAETGPICARLKASTQVSPVNVEIRIIQRL